MVALERDRPGADNGDMLGATAGRWMGRRRLVVLVSVLALAVALSAAPLASGQDDAVAWRDADVASARLGQAQDRLLDARDERDRIERRLEELRSREVSVDAETLDIAEDLNDIRKRARRLAVESYMAGGSLPDAVFLLDAATANDFAYRSTLLTEGADALADSTDAYVELRSDASAAAIELSDRIDRLERDLAQARVEIDAAGVAVAQAEEVLRIAEIHAGADRTIARTGRAEPTEEQWRQLRECEAVGVYTTNTGNGFYGAYQFTLETWRFMGGVGLPSDASSHEQDARARALYALEGAGPWPLCGRFLPGG